MLVKPTIDQIGRVDPTGPRWVLSWITGTETASEVKIRSQLLVLNTVFVCSSLQNSCLLH